jgi:DNA polymerase-3 subunit beta
MKFIASTGTLLKHLQSVQGVISSNSLLPILENFLFELNDGILKISTTDLHTSMTTSLEVESASKGKIAVPSKMLMETLKSLPEQPINFGWNEENFAIEISSETGKYRLSGEDGNDFPTIQELKDGNNFKIPAKALSEAITNTLFAVSNDELRLAMTGVNFDMKLDKLEFAATDAHKLVKHTLQMELPTEGSVIVPKKALNLLKSVLPNSMEIVSVFFSDSNIFFSFEGNTLNCRLIDAKYPDYNAVIPAENPNVVRINRFDFLGALRRTSIYSNKTTNQVRLKIQGSTLIISAEDNDFASQAEERLICEYSGDDMEIGFNARFLIEMLNTIGTEEVIFELSLPSRPGLLFPGVKVDNVETLMLIMPVMLNNYN